MTLQTKLFNEKHNDNISATTIPIIHRTFYFSLLVLLQWSVVTVGDH